MDKNPDGHTEQLLVSEDEFDSAQPLRCVVLCCTSVPADQRSELAQKASQMGADHKFDLTSDVTHLIVGEYDTPKYRYVAKERSDIKVILPSFIDAVNKLWVEDQPIDLAAIETRYLRPIFKDLRICLTGFECFEERQSIASLIEQHGGVYSGDLTKQMTHLIAYKAEGNKYQYARNWRLQIVAIEWLHESIQRGMILDEKLYGLGLSSDMRGQGAWKRADSPSMIPPKRARDSIAAEDGVRKVRRSMSTKLNSQNEQIWGDIMGGGASSPRNGGQREWATGQTEGVLQVSRSIVMPSHAQPTQSIADIHPVLHMGQGGAMDGCTILIHGFNPKHENLLHKTLVSYDAEVVTSMAELSRSSSALLLVVVSHNTTASKMPALSKSVRIEIVTELWVERCMESKSFIRPEEYQLGKPFLNRPIPGFADLTICSSGLTGVQILHVAKVVKLLGATYDENFTAHHSVLLCNADRPIRAQKLECARAWRIPVVSLSWLFDCANQKVQRPFKPYLYRAQDTSRRVLSESRLRHSESVLGDGFSNPVDVPRIIQTVPAPSVDSPAFQVEDSIHIDHDDAMQQEQDIAVVPEVAKANSAPNNAGRPSIRIKSEEKYQSPSFMAVVPLGKRSSNSPERPSTSPEKLLADLGKVDVVPRKDISTAISSLLASAKTTLPSAPDTIQPQKRRQGRILGRAASNVSLTSVRESRASSVDSTASTGQAVVWPGSASSKPAASGSREFRSDRMDYVADEYNEKNETQFPGSTQIGYEDTASTDHKDQIMAKLEGKARPDKKALDRVATVATMDPVTIGPVSRRTRQR